MSGAGYLHATEVLDQLSGDQIAFLDCLQALKNGEEGQRLLALGDSSRALVASKKAEAMFARIPQARFLLGICKADLAAAYGNLGNWEDAIRYAREAIDISAEDTQFLFTQAAASMTLGNALYSSGRPDEGARILNDARRLFGRLQEGAQYIAVVDHNELQFRGGSRKLPARGSLRTSSVARQSPFIKAAKRWWQFWK